VSTWAGGEGVSAHVRRQPDGIRTRTENKTAHGDGRFTAAAIAAGSSHVSAAAALYRSAAQSFADVSSRPRPAAGRPGSGTSRRQAPSCAAAGERLDGPTIARASGDSQECCQDHRKRSARAGNSAERAGSARRHRPLNRQPAERNRKPDAARTGLETGDPRPVADFRRE
jgi:hypothetical protein